MGQILLLVLLSVVLLAAIVLLAYVKITFRYSGTDGLKIYTTIFFFRFSFYPERRKEIKLRYYSLKNIKKREQQERKKERRKKRDIAREEKEGTAAAKRQEQAFLDIGDLFDFFTKIITIILRKFNRYLFVRIKKLIVTVGTHDAAQTAVLFGAVSQSVAYLLELIHNYAGKCQYQNGSVDVLANFCDGGWRADIHIILRIRVWQVISVALAAIFHHDRFE